MKSMHISYANRDLSSDIFFFCFLFYVWLFFRFFVADNFFKFAFGSKNSNVKCHRVL